MRYDIRSNSNGNDADVKNPPNIFAHTNYGREKKIAMEKLRRNVLVHVAILLYIWVIASYIEVLAHGSNQQYTVQTRILQSNGYITKLGETQLGLTNLAVTAGNPFKGLVVSPRSVPKPYDTSIPGSLEFYYIGVDSVIVQDPQKYGDSAFNWTSIDQLLDESESRGKHVIWRFMYDFPGSPHSFVPDWMIKSGMKMMWTTTKGTLSPFYGDPLFLKTTELFIRAMGRRYDRDNRLAFIQLGLLGYWGEWHVLGEDNILPESSKELVLRWYSESFSNKGILQTRYPHETAYNIGMGYHDDSFAYSTLDGIYNGGITRNSFFWSDIKRSNQTDFWREGVMGGEFRPEVNEILWDPKLYKTNTENRQDVETCIRTTHTTYMKHASSFRPGSLTAAELAVALKMHSIMGYAFRVKEIGLRSGSTTSSAAVDVVVENVGIAPFYFGLTLRLGCPDLATPLVQAGLRNLKDRGMTMSLSFDGIPKTDSCLQAISLWLESPRAYNNDSPIKWAQGNGNVTVSLSTRRTATGPLILESSPRKAPVPVSLPIPIATTVKTPTAPVTKPIVTPVKAPVTPTSPVTKPVKSPVTPTAPVTKPIVTPLKAPVTVPVKVPVKAPLAPVAPTKLAATKPIVAPVRSPVKSPTKSPLKPVAVVPIKAPIKVPTVVAPVKKPTKTPVKPVATPVRSPTKAPIAIMKPATAKQPIKPILAPIKVTNPVAPRPIARANNPLVAPVRSPQKVSAPVKAPTQAPVSIPAKSCPIVPCISLYGQGMGIKLFKRRNGQCVRICTTRDLERFKSLKGWSRCRC